MILAMSPMAIIISSLMKPPIDSASGTAFLDILKYRGCGTRMDRDRRGARALLGAMVGRMLPKMAIARFLRGFLMK